MTDIDVDAIRARAEAFRACDEGPGVLMGEWGLVSSASARDVPALLSALAAAQAEVERLTEGYDASESMRVTAEAERDAAEVAVNVVRAWMRGQGDV